ncbi:bacterio-opsin activator domain-containing protein [Halomicroarcula sp. GCM10025709]|uniref:helix-turn-helix domain-containing protein n=1 Tax=Haloarcula TaxID=2237 RepID=UPI0024C35B49|nr:helix-turn-helix domain-containing protein [Halomicroarcula sp. YJ-61-S]
MSVLATVELPADAFVLDSALSENPGIRVRLERVIPVGSTFIPYFWASDDSIDAIEAALQVDDDIDSFEILDSTDGETLVRAEWAEDIDGVLDALATADGSIIEGVGEANTWTFSFRFRNHDDLSSFYRACVDRDIRIDIQSIHNPGIPETFGLGFDITEAQREALMTALEAGYYDVPRNINLTDLAAELGLSDTATKQRISRGTAALLRATLTHGQEETTDDTKPTAEDT